MSYDLEVRSDDSYSRTESRERVVLYLRDLGARTTDSSATFMLYDDPAKGQRIEIDLGYEGTGGGERVNFVGFGVPYAFLSASGLKVVELAFAIAAHLGWRLYDPQAGRYLEETEQAVAIASQASALAAVDHVSAPAARIRRGLALRVLDRLIRQTKFMVVVAVLAFGMIGIYAVWRNEVGQREDPRPFVGTVLASALAAVLLRPLVLELIDRID